MNTVFLIGNGFDINLGLPTRYHQFYRYYVGQEVNDPPEVAKLKNHLREYLSGENQYWSDLEQAMGQYTEQFPDRHVMESVYDDINDKMRTYLQSIDIAKYVAQADAEKLKASLCQPDAALPSLHRDRIGNYMAGRGSSNRISIINFNYTDTIERIVEDIFGPMEIGKSNYKGIAFTSELRNIWHIHGTLADPIMGVNDENQIANANLRDIPEVKNYLLKTVINANLAHAEDRTCFELLGNAHLICIYGMSLGPTDALWWKRVASRALEGAKVIMYVHDPKNRNLPARKFENYCREEKRKLADASGIADAVRETFYSNIYLSQNDPLFDLKKPEGIKDKLRT